MSKKLLAGCDPVTATAQHSHKLLGADDLTGGEIEFPGTDPRSNGHALKHLLRPGRAGIRAQGDSRVMRHIRSGSALSA